MRLFAIAVLASALSTLAAPAEAAVTIGFDELATRVQINNYYNGGIASDGTISQSGNIGLQFINFTTAHANNPSSRIAFNSSSPALVNFLAGFTTLNFDYGFTQAGTVTVYSDLNATGAVLGTAVFAANVASATGQAFGAGRVAFSGLGRSFLLAGTNGTLAIDNLVLGTTPVAALPELGTWGLMVVGFGAMGASLRSRRRTARVALA